MMLFVFFAIKYVVSISIAEQPVSCLQGALVNDGVEQMNVFIVLPFKYLCFSSVALLLCIHVCKDPSVE